MKVETYEVEPVSQNEMQQLAADGEHAMLIESLGLTGQRELIGGNKNTPFPYRIMTAAEQRVYEEVFPIKTEMEKFASELIPLRVLQVAAHARDTGFLDKGLYIWHPEDSRHDPLLVGYASIPGQTWGQRFFTLARWGEALLSFDQLKQKAIKSWSAGRKQRVLSAQQKLSGELTNVDATATAFFENKSIETYISF